MVKEVANANAALVKEFKCEWEQKRNPEESYENREAGSPSDNSLVRSVNFLIQDSSLPEFAPTSAIISNKGREAQEPIVGAG